MNIECPDCGDDCDCAAFGLFKNCKGRKRCKGCEYFRPGDPYKDGICYCPEDVEGLDDEAKKFLNAFAKDITDLIAAYHQVRSCTLETSRQKTNYDVLIQHQQEQYNRMLQER